MWLKLLIEENNDEIPKEIALQLQYNNSALATHIAIHVARVAALTAPCHPCCCSNETIKLQMRNELRIGSWKLKDALCSRAGVAEASSMKPKTSNMRVAVTTTTTTTITCGTILLLKCINQQFCRCFFFSLLGVVLQQGKGVL